MALFHRTALRDIEHKSGEYPVALNDAVSLLIEEQRNFVPMYMPFDTMNSLEARVMEAERRNIVEGVEEAIRARQEIEAFKGNVRNMVRGLALTWEVPYAYGVLLSNDIFSSNPAITKPKDPQFSFQLSPKEFDLGLSGRLLEDSQGRRYQESLVFPCDIYDAYGLAVELHPQRVVAVDVHENQTVVYESGKEVGKRKILGNSTQSKKPIPWVYVFSEDQLYSDDMQVLPTNGLKIVFSDFYEKVRKYKRGAMLFGHKYSDLKEFLSMVRVLDQHLIWDVCASFQTQYGGLDAPLIDCERVHPMENAYVKKFPENKNRLQFIPDRATLDLGASYLRFDKATAIQAMMSLGEVITDIWLEPIGKRWNQGWDIVYDRRRGITPDKPVHVMGVENIEGYHVLKGYSR